MHFTQKQDSFWDYINILLSNNNNVSFNFIFDIYLTSNT